ncbi:hypothetical protein BJ508DRAFT_414194 [Ascobolus immersus RN42]|uniref:Uncharacterized protein n=1 Tax=Ascobolus immersus RN42 TaxID=1160509 RepID=A0A3N4ICI2_ASCIM|nr:hypothetical protein BJ508DRAFT_414194 [Ascobolus immersus RN42]
MAVSEPTSFNSLPAEIRLLIGKQLTCWSDLQAYRQTNTTNYTLLESVVSAYIRSRPIQPNETRMVRKFYSLLSDTSEENRRPRSLFQGLLRLSGVRNPQLVIFDVEEMDWPDRKDRRTRNFLSLLQKVFGKEVVFDVRHLNNGETVRRAINWLHDHLKLVESAPWFLESFNKEDYATCSLSNEGVESSDGQSASQLPALSAERIEMEKARLRRLRTHSSKWNPQANVYQAVMLLICEWIGTFPVKLTVGEMKRIGLRRELKSTRLFWANTVRSLQRNLLD